MDTPHSVNTPVSGIRSDLGLVLLSRMLGVGIWFGGGWLLAAQTAPTCEDTLVWELLTAPALIGWSQAAVPGLRDRPRDERRRGFRFHGSSVTSGT